jgi:hypothetical protein
MNFVWGIIVENNIKTAHRERIETLEKRSLIDKQSIVSKPVKCIPRNML